ncbi:MAG: hypothetical protein AAF571_08945 [Verrucomicrobiota bacterium]
MKSLSKNIVILSVATVTATLLLTSCQKEEPKSPFEQMGDSMNKAAKDMEKAAEEAAKEAEKAAEEAAKEAEKLAKEAEQAAKEATE